ncbi:MAG TPA: hypothetical protein VMW01_04065 [Williamwhitmania sp.]|nr:hypothetical protein [Williamwhitmania sp.]
MLSNKPKSDEKKMTMKERMAKLREMRGSKQRAEEKKRGEKTNLPGSGRRKVSPAKKKTPASKERSPLSPAEQARWERRRQLLDQQYKAAVRAGNVKPPLRKKK